MSRRVPSCGRAWGRAAARLAVGGRSGQCSAAEGPACVPRSGAAISPHHGAKRQAMPSSDHLIWIDLEMTGLKPDSDAIIEIATVVTDRNLDVIAEGPNLAIHQPDEVLARMDEWNQKQHGTSGLLARVKASTISIAD